MTGYIIIEANKTQTLVDEVNAMVTQGWEPLGGPTATDNLISQAMTKDVIEDVISEKFIVKEKGIVPGETGPEFHFSYEYKGKRGDINLGKGLHNYTDEELEKIVTELIKNINVTQNHSLGIVPSLDIDFEYEGKHYTFVKELDVSGRPTMMDVKIYCVEYLEKDRAI